MLRSVDLAGILARTACLIIFLLLFSTLAYASVCTISATGVNFGSYNSLSGGSDSVNGTITVDCPSGLSYYVNRNDGSYYGGGFQSNMASGSNRIQYTLYRDASYSSKWGNTNGSDGIAGVGTGGSQQLTMYARVNQGQTSPPGAYNDSVIATLRNSGGNVTGVVSINASNQASCNISANPLNFGIYSGAQLDASSNLSISCTSTTPYSVDLNNGNFGGRMNGPAGSRLPYTLFTNAQRSQTWGTGRGGVAVAGTGSGGVQQLTVYGRI